MNYQPFGWKSRATASENLPKLIIESHKFQIVFLLTKGFVIHTCTYKGAFLMIDYNVSFKTMCPNCKRTMCSYKQDKGAMLHPYLPHTSPTTIN